MYSEQILQWMRDNPYPMMVILLLALVTFIWLMETMDPDP